MTRVRVWLNDVRCTDTEDVTGADEFYLIGAVSDGEHTSPILTRPQSINNGQTISPVVNGTNLVFDHDVPEDRVLKVALAAFDEDSGKDWNRYGEYVGAVGTGVSEVLKRIPNPYTIAAGFVLPYAIGAVGAIASMDQDDPLGEHAGTYWVNTMDLNREDKHSWVFLHDGGWWSSWDYVARYTVAKGRIPRDRL
jgi:hypothetical protein